MLKSTFESNRSERMKKNNNNNCWKNLIFFTRTATKCSDLPPPKGGAKACDDWMFGTFCSPFCSNKSDFAQPLPATMWVCGARGTWMPTNRFPDCTSE